MDTEARIQSQIVKWYTNTYCLMHHHPRCLIMSIPNGGQRSSVTGSISKSTGEYTGASDLLIIHYGKIVFVEVKTPVGKQSKAQQEFQAHVEGCGYPYHLVRSEEGFKKLISEL